MSAITGTIETFGATHAPRRTLRSIGAVFAGLLVVVVLSTAADAVLHATGVYPPFPRRMADELFLLATAYRIAFGILGCYVAARLAPRRPMRHALVLGCIGTVLSIAGAARMWAYGPAWYTIAIIAIALPCAWIGGRLHEARSGAR
jgi:MFS family permease